MIPYSGSLTEDDYVAIAGLRRRIGPRPRSLAEWSAYLGVAFLALAGWALVIGLDNREGAASWAMLAIPCFLFAWFRRYDPRKEWRAQPELRGPYAGQVTSEALESRMLGTDTRVPWAAVAGYAASPRALVLGMGRLDVPLVRGFFPTEEEWQSVRAIIEKNVPVTPTEATSRNKAALFWLSVLVVVLLAWIFARVEMRSRRIGNDTEQTPP